MRSSGAQRGQILALSLNEPLGFGFSPGMLEAIIDPECRLWPLKIQGLQPQASEWPEVQEAEE